MIFGKVINLGVNCIRGNHSFITEIILNPHLHIHYEIGPKLKYEQ